MEASARPEGIAGSDLAGPFAVGAYAARLRDHFKTIARVQVFGEVVNLRTGTGAKVYFELRDAGGALPCSMWRNEFEKAGVPLADGAQVVVAGGPSYYPGSRTSSGSFSFEVTSLRLSGEGDLLVQIEALRKRLAAEGLLEPQKALHRPVLPKCIGVVTGEAGKARDDVLAGLQRRGWAGKLVWAFAPVQDRHAAPRITQALQDLAAIEEVEVIVVARGGGSLADLLAFCDETLCRTVAMLRTPVIASVGHHTDRPLIDDVAAVRCSTPTHAAETAVPTHVGEAHSAQHHAAQRLAHHARTAILGRARHLAQLSRAPAEVVARHRRTLHQKLREIRASATRGIADRRALAGVQALVLSRKASAGAGPEQAGRVSRLEGLASALAAHDPERVVARGYAVVDDGEGNLVTSAEAAKATERVRLFFGDGDVRARIEE
jgi:exodeoxyribonuclease VII large subunit